MDTTLSHTGNFNLEKLFKRVASPEFLEEINEFIRNTPGILNKPDTFWAAKGMQVYTQNIIEDGTNSIRNNHLFQIEMREQKKRARKNSDDMTFLALYAQAQRQIEELRDIACQWGTLAEDLEVMYAKLIKEQDKDQGTLTLVNQAIETLEAGKELTPDMRQGLRAKGIKTDDVAILHLLQNDLTQRMNNRTEMIEQVDKDISYADEQKKYCNLHATRAQSLFNQGNPQDQQKLIDGQQEDLTAKQANLNAKIKWVRQQQQQTPGKIAATYEHNQIEQGNAAKKAFVGAANEAKTEQAAVKKIKDSVNNEQAPESVPQINYGPKNTF